MSYWGTSPCSTDVQELKTLSAPAAIKPLLKRTTTYMQSLTSNNMKAATPSNSWEALKGQLSNKGPIVGCYYVSTAIQDHK